MPIGVPISAPRKRPSRASVTVVWTGRQSSPLFNSRSNLSPIRLGRLLKNSLNRLPAANSQTSSNPMMSASRQSQAEKSTLSPTDAVGGIISSAMTGSVMRAFGSRQIAQSDNVPLGEFLHRRVSHPQHLQRGFESGLLRAPVMGQTALGRILGNRYDEVRRQRRKPLADRGLYRLRIGLNDLLGLDDGARYRVRGGVIRLQPAADCNEIERQIVEIAEIGDEFVLARGHVGLDVRRREHSGSDRSAFDRRAHRGSGSRGDDFVIAVRVKAKL